MYFLAYLYVLVALMALATFSPRACRTFPILRAFNAPLPLVVILASAGTAAVLAVATSQ